MNYMILIAGIMGLVLAYVIYPQQADVFKPAVGSWQEYRNSDGRFEETWTIEDSNPLVVWTGRA